MTENSFQTSFIPKRPVANTRSIREPMGIFTLLGIIILVLMTVASVGLYFYKDYLTKQKSSLSASLLKGKGYFEENTISELDSFSKKTKDLKKLLDNHVAVSLLFPLIGQITIPSVTYTSFSYDSSTSAVSLDATAPSYKDVIIQSDIFNTPTNKYFHNVVFSNVSKDKNGQISFKISFNVDPSILSYKNSLNSDTSITNVNNQNP